MNDDADKNIQFRPLIERFPAEGLAIIIVAIRTHLDLTALALGAADLFLPLDG